MPPRTKRPRTSSNASDTNTEGGSKEDGGTNNIPSVKIHDKLWYNDGSIVLATDVHLYRVHKSILAKQSTVFRDMFHGSGNSGDESMEGSSACVDSCSEQWDGLPLVKLVGDEDEDVCHFLMALYDRNFFRTHQPSTVTFDVFSSLCTMSIKYDANDLRSELIDYLSQFYPDNLKAFDKERSREAFGDEQDDEDFRLLRLAKLCDAYVLLPAIFYSCANNSLDVITTSDILDREDMSTIAVGREKMVKGSYEVATKVLLHGKNTKCRSAECLEKRTDFLMTHLNYSSSDSPPFPLELTLDGVLPRDPAARTDLCKSCVKSYREIVKSTRVSFWKELPGVFNLGTWDEVREKMKKT